MAIYQVLIIVPITFLSTRPITGKHETHRSISLRISFTTANIYA